MGATWVGEFKAKASSCAYFYLNIHRDIERLTGGGLEEEWPHS